MDMTDLVYSAKAGETFDTIALEAYGNEKYAAELMCANPDITGKIVFDGGELIAFPVIDLTENETEGEDEEGYTLPNAPWKE